jgi:calcium/calmodulin-dependent protein kinase I
VDHPFIVKLLASYEDEQNLYLVTDFCEGGELFDFLHLKGTYSEEFASTLLRRLLCALEYLHEKGIVHRDLKPENLLLRKPNDALSVVLVDFGLSGRISERKPLLFSRCGSPHYCAPEVLGACGYDEKVDIWSVGCIAFALLSGTVPFDASSNGALKRMVRRGVWTFDEYHWEGVSEEARRFVSSLLAVDAHRRPSARQALTDPWLDVG